MTIDRIMGIMAIGTHTSTTLFTPLTMAGVPVVGGLASAPTGEALITMGITGTLITDTLIMGTATMATLITDMDTRVTIQAIASITGMFRITIVEDLP